MNKFLKIQTWADIIKSRTTARKNRKTEWYKSRMLICSVCPLNSKFHEPENWKESFWKFITRDKDYCKACLCTLKEKLSIKHAVCGKEEIGETPLWREIE